MRAQNLQLPFTGPPHRLYHKTHHTELLTFLRHLKASLDAIAKPEETSLGETHLQEVCLEGLTGKGLGLCRGRSGNVAGAALWGVLRCAALELPSLGWCGSDISPATAHASWRQVSTTQEFPVATPLCPHVIAGLAGRCGEFALASMALTTLPQCLIASAECHMRPASLVITDQQPSTHGCAQL